MIRIAAAVLGAATAWVGGVAAQEVRFPEGRDRVIVPLRERDFFMLGRSLIVDLEFGGEKRPFVLDTGSADCSVHPRLLRRLRLKPRGRARIIGQTKMRKIPVYRIPEPRLGGLELQWMVANALDPDHSEVYEEDVAGLLGSAFFRTTPFTIDCRRRVLIVHRPGAFEPPKGAVRVPLRYAMGIPHARARLSSGKRYRFDVDTGYTGVLFLNAPFVRRNKLLEGRRDLPSAQMHGVFGSSDYSMALLGELGFGDLTLRDLPVDLSHDSTKGGLAENAFIAGTLGAGFIAYFVATFDYPRNALWLVPQKGFDGRFPHEHGLIITRTKRGLEVTHVFEGSAAGRAGMREGDVLAELDGEPVPERASDLAALLLGRPRARLTVRRGDSTRELALERRAYLSPVRLAGRK